MTPVNLMNILTVFHKSDFDGLCSEAIARQTLGNDSDYFGFEYGDALPDLTSFDTIYLLDISLPVEVMREHAKKIVWIDHHKTAMEAMADITFNDAYTIDGIAACRLAYQYLVNHCKPAKQAYIERVVREPYAVQMLGEYDVWRRDNPHTDLFQLGIAAEKAPKWHLLLRCADEAGPGAEHVLPYYIENVIESGRAIQSYLEVQNAKLASERGFDIRWEGFLFRVLNTARCNSLTFTAALRPEHDGCLGYFWDGVKWRLSLYGVPRKPDIDLSVIAKKYGGGGHPQAAGATLSSLPLELGGFHAPQAPAL